ncbi:MAG: hypothetical protein VX871_00850 [Pseudomonadota bacterium]|nr:hypothetical protein [Pseudomonadota bacterium]
MTASPYRSGGPYRAIRPVILSMLVAGLLAGCSTGSRLGLTEKPKDASAPAPVDLSRENSPSNRATQVAWTAARAQYCAFNMRSEKLRVDYLAYEGRQGLSAEDMAKLTRLYDLTYNTFYAQIRETPTYCTRDRIDEIRPEINRHLAGDYTPADRKPPPIDVDLPSDQNFKEAWERRKADPAQHEDPR